MKTNIVMPVPPLIKAQDAIPGHLYLWQREVILCFKPCFNHAYPNFKSHFIRIADRDTTVPRSKESLMMIGNEEIVDLGEAYVSNVIP